MAGSYHHIMERDHRPGSWSMIEDMGDAAECVEELLFLVRALGTNDQIDHALEVYYARERGESTHEFSEAYQDCKAIFDDR